METAVRLLASFNLHHRFNVAMLRLSTPLWPALDLMLDLQAMWICASGLEDWFVPNSSSSNHSSNYVQDECDEAVLVAIRLQWSC